MFATLLVLFAFLVIRTENPVHAVLYLVLVFCLNSCLLLLLGAEFISLLLLIVYVGAIAILFLFVVMMLPIKNKRDITILQDLPLGMAIGAILALEMIFIVNYELPSVDPDTITRFKKWYLLVNEKDYMYITTYRELPSMLTDLFPFFSGKENAKAFGLLLYSHNFYYVLIAGFVLLLAIVGAVMLARHDITDEKQKPLRQDISHQMSRRFENAILMVQFTDDDEKVAAEALPIPIEKKEDEDELPLAA